MLAPSSVRAQNANILVSPVPGELAGTPAHPYLVGLQDVRLGQIDPATVEVADASSVLSAPDLGALALALAGDSGATEGATSLTLDLRKLGRIGPQEEVAGRDGSRVLTAQSIVVTRMQR